MTKAGYIGVGEMWGNYFEWRCMNNSAALGYSFGNIGLGDKQKWFKPQIMEELQNAPCNLTPAQIYACLTNDVTNHIQLRDKLISKYGMSAQITKVFKDNGFPAIISPV